MAPTSVLSSSPLSTSPQPPSKMTSAARKDPFDVSLCLEDLDNSCETYFCCRDVSPSPRSVIPEASDAFRAALDKMKDDEQRLGYASLTSSLPSSQPKKTTSIYRSVTPRHSSTSSFSSSSSTSSSSFLNTPEPRGYSRNDTKRAASFGGADLVKPRQGRRSSHSEKRVSWADERGSSHQLIHVRIIRPRMDMAANTGLNKTPGQSILRHSGSK